MRARRPVLLTIAASTAAALVSGSFGAGPAVATAAAAASAASVAPATSRARPQLRVDQVGYLASEAKHAYLMAAAPMSAPEVDVVDGAGRVVAHATVATASRGTWNAAYPDVYDVDLSAVTRPGSYRLVLRGATPATPVTSDAFPVTSLASLWSPLLSDGVSFDQLQRDGADVVRGSLGRKPSHLNDRHATVYATPHFDPDTDEITAPDLVSEGVKVDVEGGWFDAGDYLKFTHTTAYNDVVLYASVRALGAAAPKALLAEARHGSDWLSKMWDQRSRTLYLQVGTGSGNAAGTFLGDHDLWRLPERDDSDTSPMDRYAAAHRPVFRAAAPGAKISPNLVGRVSAAFALAAQVDAASHPTRSARELQQATSLYAMADTASPPQPLVTALPNDYYPESTWRDDMQLGATEIARARMALRRSPGRYLSDAARWAHAYEASDTGDTFNLYDTSALADADLAPAIGHRHLAVTRSELVADLRRQIDGAATRSASDPFRAAGDYDSFDVDAHTLGLIASIAWYHSLTGDSKYDAVATAQRDWVFGANAWGSSFMVGEGTTYPRCMQHQVANLRGSTDGRAPIAVGAVVNGPNSADLFSDGLGGLQDGMVACPPDQTKPPSVFDGRGSSWIDDVRSWQTDEPALDMTAGAIAAAASQLALDRSRARAPRMPEHVFAPYFEAYNGDSPAVLSQQSGATHLTMAFVQTAVKGSCTVYWNGDTSKPISRRIYGTDIDAIRARGGDVIASFGGYSADHDGTDIADGCTSVPKIAAAYEKVISTYDLRRIDLDVEDLSLARTAAITRRSKAIAQVQAWAQRHGRRLQVSWTLPVEPAGLESDGLGVLTDAHRHGARIDVANIMTFDYYDNQPHDMLTDAEGAATAVVQQLKTVAPHATAKQRWGMLGITQMVGIDDFGPAETFQASQAAPLRRWAEQRGVDTLSFWALQRDNGGCVGTAGSDFCSGVPQSTWQFTRALEPFTGS